MVCDSSCLSNYTHPMPWAAFCQSQQQPKGLVNSTALVPQTVLQSSWKVSHSVWMTGRNVWTRIWQYTIYLDFMKAFDKISHEYLIHKLENLGTHQKIPHWMHDILNGWLTPGFQHYVAVMPEP